jgi:hypothetical protein
MTTPPTPGGQYPEPDSSESSDDAVEPERFELPTFETFETPPFESISSGSFETPPAPPPSPELVDEPEPPPVPAAPEPPSAPQVAWHSPVEEAPVPVVAHAPEPDSSAVPGRTRWAWIGAAIALLVVLVVVSYVILT